MQHLLRDRFATVLVLELGGELTEPGFDFRAPL
jgi:hypothetical protein